MSALASVSIDVPDLTQGVAFYCAAFGFTEKFSACARRRGPARSRRRALPAREAFRFRAVARYE